MITFPDLKKKSPWLVVDKIGNTHGCSVRVSIPWKSTGNFRDLRCWLIDNIHEDDYVLYGADLNYYNNRVVYFRYEQDAILFKLRWL